MARLNPTERAKVQLSAGDQVRIVTPGRCAVQGLSGSPLTTTTLTATSQDFGPYGVPAVLLVTCLSGSADYSLLGDSVALTDAQEAAIQTQLSGPAGRAASPAAISLPPHIQALWFPMNEGAGTKITDRVRGAEATVSGATTNLWATRYCASFAADTAFVLRNDPLLDALMRLDTLQGSLIIGFELESAILVGSQAVMGFGDTGDAVNGAYAIYAANSGGETICSIAYAAKGGATFATLPNGNMHGNLIVKRRQFFHIVINAYNGWLWFDGYEAGWISRSNRARVLEGSALPVGQTSRGLRIGGRPSGGAGASANFIGTAQTALPKIANFHVIRITGDYRHMIPTWIEQINATMPYGAIPGVFNG